MSEHPEKYCSVCGTENRIWFAPDHIWKAVMRGNEGILCPLCFIKKEGVYEDSLWMVIPEQEFTKLQFTKLDLLAQITRLQVSNAALREQNAEIKALHELVYGGEE